MTLKKIINTGYVRHAKSRSYELTEKGQQLAEKIYERHEIFLRYLKSIGVPERIAQKDACRLEHAFSEESYLGLKIYVEKCGFTENH